MAQSKPVPTRGIIRKLVIGLVALLALDAAGVGGLVDPEHADPASPAVVLVKLVAPGFFLFAFLMLDRVMTRIERRERFSEALTRQMYWIGGGLMLGGWAAILFQPAMLYLMKNGFAHLTGVSLDWSVQNIVLCVLGLFVLAIAQAAASLQKSLDGFV